MEATKIIDKRCLPLRNGNEVALLRGADGTWCLQFSHPIRESDVVGGAPKPAATVLQESGNLLTRVRVSHEAACALRALLSETPELQLVVS